MAGQLLLARRCWRRAPPPPPAPRRAPRQPPRRRETRRRRGADAAAARTADERAASRRRRPRRSRRCRRASDHGAAAPPNRPLPRRAATPATLTKIAVSYPDGGAHLPLFIARDKGIFDKYGLEVDLKPLGGGSVATAALLGGDIQMLDITGSEIVTADAQGADVLVLATLTPSYPYVFEVTKDITNKEDLKGKTIAIRAVGDATDIATRVMLKKEGLDPTRT